MYWRPTYAPPGSPAPKEKVETDAQGKVDHLLKAAVVAEEAEAASHAPVRTHPTSPEIELS